VTLPPPRPCPMMPIHTNQPWFHGHISRERSVSLLAEHGLVDGFVPNSLDCRELADTVSVFVGTITFVTSKSRVATGRDAPRHQSLCPSTAMHGRNCHAGHACGTGSPSPAVGYSPGLSPPEKFSKFLLSGTL